MFDQYDILGSYFGYPQCCIDNFKGIVATMGRSRTANQEDEAVHQRSGFVPCPEHANQIKEGKILLKDLISHRICPTPFPSSPSQKEVLSYLGEEMGKLNIQEE